jgi:hypothetical protein
LVDLFLGDEGRNEMKRRKKKVVIKRLFSKSHSHYGFLNM